MSSAQLETFLARLYTDRALREQFLNDPEAQARHAGLQDHEVEALAAIDRIGLQMAAHSFDHKRAAHSARHGVMARLIHWIRKRFRVKRTSESDGRPAD
ncbi:MAG TPA: hypothetical protein VF472_24850 [Burkholderiaceae bacterium]